MQKIVFKASMTEFQNSVQDWVSATGCRKVLGIMPGEEAKLYNIS